METNRAWNNGGRKMVAYLSRVLVVLRLPDRYHPERHYMRGPGPKWLAKHRNCDECRTRSSCPVIDGCEFHRPTTAVGAQAIEATYAPRIHRAFETWLVMACSTKVRVRTRWIIHSLGATVAVLCISDSVPQSSAPKPALAPSSAIAAVPVDEQGRRIALVIGNSAYRSVNPLKNPEANSKIVAQRSFASWVSGHREAQCSLTGQPQTFKLSWRKGDQCRLGRRLLRRSRRRAGARLQR